MTDSAMLKPPPSELRLRVLSGVVMVVIALAALWWGGWPFAALWIAAGAVAAWEWSRITHPERPDYHHVIAGLGVAVAGWLVAADHGLIGLLWVAAMVALCAFSDEARRREQATGVIYASAIAIAPVVVRSEPDVGAALITWCFAVVWSTDIAAYFAGRAFGGPKLWPAVSPKKTWSGALGGAVAGVAAGLAVALVSDRLGFEWPIPLWQTAIAALAASAAGQLGDLAESALKRSHGVKDSSSIIPGHGGVLDRLDAFVVVVSLVALTVVLAW